MATISGGDKMDAALAAIAARLKKGGLLKVGFLEGAKYPNGTSVALVAAVQNFGAPARGIPPRPFFSNMVQDKSPTWAPALAGLLKSTGYDVEAALQMMGEGIKGQLQQSIRDTNAPPLSPLTIERKGFDKPLIDTGHMINSVDYEVTA
jgi:hypothetical protein